MKHKLRLMTVFVLLLGTISFVAQAQTVSGTITDTNNNPLPGVNVVIQGTTTGTTSDFSGKYSLSAGSDAVLVFSFIGYKSQSVTVGSQTSINVQMAEDVSQLEEIVVSALGFEIKKDQLGSTAAVVKSEDMVRSGEAMLLNSLGAKASNVQVQRTNGDPGAGTNIRIRGASSILGSQGPLVIVDGVPISNTTYYGIGNEGKDEGTSQQSRLNDLNPNDIESMQILKGASAAALWGSRAANGIIVITTKNGGNSKLKLSYKGTYSVDQVNTRIPMQNTFGQGRDGVYGATRAESWGDYIPDRSGAADEVDNSGEYFEAANGNRYYPLITKNSQETFDESNWDGAFQDGHFFQHDLTANGGNKDANFFFSLSRLDQEGIIIGSEYDRTNVRLNSNFNVNNWFKISMNSSYINSFSNRIQQSSNTAGLLLGLLRTPPDFDNTDYIGTYYDASGTAYTRRHRSFRRYLANTGNPTYNNPMWTTREQEATSRVNRYMIRPQFTLTPTNWLQIILRGGVDGYNDKRVYFFPVGSASHTSGVFSEETVNEVEFNFDGIAKGNFNLTSDISLQATLGWNFNDRKLNTFWAEINGFAVNALKQTTDLNSAAENSRINNGKLYRRSNRGYGILAFDLYNQLNVSLTGALEAASTMKGSYFYPSIETAWRITDAFDIGGSVLSFAKIRATWGKVGIPPPAYLWENTTEGGFTYSTYSDPLRVAQFGGGFRLNDDLGNPDITPEIKTEWEIGADARLFEDNLSVGVTYYQNQITDMHLYLSLSPSTGFDTQFANAAEMKNQGFELDLDYTVFRNTDWNVGVYANYSDNNNEVTKLPVDSHNLTSGASVSSRAVVGESLGVLFGTGSKTLPDGSFDLDANGFPQLTDRPVILGDPNPDWRGGLGVRASWKGLALNVLVEHSQGGDFSPRTLWVLRRFGTTQETANRFTTTEDLVNFDGDLIPSGTTVRGNVEDFGAGNVLLDETWYRHGIGGGFGDNQAYNFSIKDATFTRLRELSLSYTLNSSGFQNATKLGSIVLTATGRNLFLWTEMEGVDPEINQYGVDNGYGLDYFTNPSTRSFLVSVQINF